MTFNAFPASSIWLIKGYSRIQRATHGAHTESQLFVLDLKHAPVIVNDNNCEDILWWPGRSDAVDVPLTRATLERAKRWRQQRHPIYATNKQTNTKRGEEDKKHRRIFVNLRSQSKNSQSWAGSYYSLLPRLVFNNFRPNSCWLSVRRFFIIKSELKNCAKLVGGALATPASLKLNLWPLSMRCDGSYCGQPRLRWCHNKWLTLAGLELAASPFESMGTYLRS